MVLWSSGNGIVCNAIFVWLKPGPSIAIPQEWAKAPFL
jgi:hypothetical protein